MAKLIPSISIIGFEDACEAIRGAVRPVSSERIPLTDALGRFAAEDIVADADLIPFDRSSMDGFAVFSGDTRAASPEHPVVFRVTQSVFAERGHSILTPETAMAISTGAPIPRGADAVIPIEDVQENNGTILVSAPVTPRCCIFPAGEDTRRGELLVLRGQMIRPATLGLLAFIGKASLTVYRRPRVSVTCTGSELIAAGATPSHGEIRNSNGLTLTTLVKECGGEATDFGIVADDRQALKTFLESAGSDCDMIITTGGASAGQRDLIKGVLQQLGVDFRFQAVAVRPGKPTGFGVWHGMPVFALPGNPAAAFVSFHVLIRPALLHVAGCHCQSISVVRAVLNGHARSKPGFRYFLLARLASTGQAFEVTPLLNQCSVLARTAADANSLIELPEGNSIFTNGEIVKVRVLDWTSVLPSDG